MSQPANILLGAVLAIVVSLLAGALSEEYKNQRRLWATARILLYELQRIWEWPEERMDRDLSSLLPVLEDYKLALFAVSRRKFEEHWENYRDLMRYLDSDREERHKMTLVLLDTRRRLSASLGWEEPGAGEILGVPETGSPVSWE
jgi:uncharacterized membrane protein YgaE (UPF0421/DUF939 family)